jgi:hypothetical protein
VGLQVHYIKPVGSSGVFVSFELGTWYELQLFQLSSALGVEASSRKRKEKRRRRRRWLGSESVSH